MVKRTFPIVPRVFRLRVKVAAIALAESDGWELEEGAFDWLEWSDARLRFEGVKISPRSVFYAVRALAVVEAIADM